MRRQAYQEASEHCQTGLGLLPTLPDTAGRLQQELAMQSTLGVALMTIKGYADPDVARAYTRARVLAQQVGDAPQLFPGAVGSVDVLLSTRGSSRPGARWGSNCWRWPTASTTRRSCWRPTWPWARTCSSWARWWRPAPTWNRPWLCSIPSSTGAHAFLYGHDPQVIGLAHLACILWVLGYPDQAQASESTRRRRWVQTVDHSYSRGLVHFFAAWFSQLSRNPQATATQAETVLTLAHEHAFHYLAALAGCFRAGPSPCRARQPRG